MTIREQAVEGVTAMPRVTAQKIAQAMKTGKETKVSKRDTVIVNGTRASYVLWYTWIVTRDTVTGEIEWNTTEYPWKYSRTTQSRIKDLQHLLG